MAAIVLSKISFTPQVDALQKALRVRREADQRALERLCAEATDVAQPKAACRPALIANRSDNSICIDDVTLTSRVLSVNLRDAHRVFLYLATCGVELDAWARGLDDLLHSFWAEEIKAQALQAATHALTARIGADYHLSKTATMNPGSLPDWPLSQQRPFFKLMGPLAGQVGIVLSDSCLMTPNKSVSGIHFATESGFESCQLCPMPECPNRRARYDAEFYERAYASDGIATGGASCSA